MLAATGGGRDFAGCSNLRLKSDPMGPLDGITILEFAGIGPGPFCAMMLSDMGADVIRIDRSDRVQGGDPKLPPADVMSRGRRSIGVDLKSSAGVNLVFRLMETSDGLIEGFRPGVMERLGLGPDECLAHSPALAYGRMTGWGQSGPYSTAAGHDINYISLAGALEPLGRKGEAPVPPLNLVGDFGGGGMYLAFGMVCAILEARESGAGQVIDAAMVDGAASLMTFFHGFRAMGVWNDERGTNLLDSGAHFYEVYETSDEKYVSIGSIEPQFYKVLREKLGLTDPKWDHQMSRTVWPELKVELMAIFKTRTRCEWCALLEGSDACFAPVLSMAEAPNHPHNAERATFTEYAGVMQPRPAPRFSRTDSEIQRPPSHAGQHTAEILIEAGYAPAEIAHLRDAGTVA